MQDIRSRGVPIRAAGGVLWRGDAASAPEEAEIAVVYRRRHADWTLPKGKLDPGESEVEAAIREVREETGQHAGLGRSLGSVRYDVDTAGGKRRKLVEYWAMRAAGGEFSPDDEVQELRWLPPGAAAATLTHESDRDVLERFLAGPPEVDRVLLLRHAEAVARVAGPDEERHLDDLGRSRSVRLAPVLALFGVTAVLASPARRCTETVAPLARSLGLEVEEERLLAEHAAGGASDLLAERVAAAGTLVACTHAPVIGQLLERFAIAEPALLPRGARLDPGGAWSLEFAGRSLVAMAYVPPPAVS
jgi:phosphohistidine phosphatase SixA/ADP-ribose pyrophosphatase YjhB (NUDIX family)